MPPQIAAFAGGIKTKKLKLNGKRIKEKVKAASTTDNHQHPAVLSSGNGSYNMNRPMP